MTPAILLVLLVLAALVVFAIERARHYRSRKAMTRRLQVVAARPDDLSGNFLKRRTGTGNSVIERILARMPGSEAFERLILHAGVEKSAGHYAAVMAQVALGAGALAGLASRSAPVGLLAGLAAGAIVLLRLKITSDKRREEFENQLPEALDFICRALRAGHGLTMAIGMVGDELPEPVGPEFKIVFDEINFGIPFDDSLSNLAERIDSTDLNFFIILTKIHKETGGNFTEILESISNTIRERIKLQGKVRILASEGKFSGILLGALPFFIGGLMTFINPEYMSELWFSEKGQNLVAIGLVLIALGFAWMWQIAKIRV